jgi:hypothetical protein
VITNSQTHSFNLGEIVWIFDIWELKPHPAIILDFIHIHIGEAKSKSDTQSLLMGFQKYLIFFKGQVIEDYDWKFKKTHDACDQMRYV